MKTLRRILGVSLLLGGCGAASAWSSDPAQPPDLATRLEQDTGVK